MKCRRKFNKLFTILILGMFAFGFLNIGMQNAVNPDLAHFAPACESLKGNYSLMDFRDCVPSVTEQSSSPMDRIFQIIFILFFISPPLIVILLFMIWCELRKRNEHK